VSQLIYKSKLNIEWLRHANKYLEHNMKDQGFVLEFDLISLRTKN